MGKAYCVLALGLALFWPTSLSAQTIRVNFIYQESPYISRGQARAQAMWATRHLTTQGIPTKMARFIASPWPQDATLANYHLGARMWGNYLAGKRYQAPDGVSTVVIAKPIDGSYIGGVARGYCRSWYTSNDNLAVAYSSAYRFNGSSGIPFTRITIVHELLHLLGAGHIDSYPNLMHMNALGYFPNLPIAEQTKREVARCQTLSRKMRS